MKYEGPVDPKITGGFENTFKYGNFSFAVFLNYQFGNKVRLHDYFRSEYNDLSAMPKDFLDRWMIPGDENITSVPAILSVRQNERKNSEYKEVYNAYNYSTERIADGVSCLTWRCCTVTRNCTGRIRSSSVRAVWRCLSLDK